MSNERGPVHTAELVNESSRLTITELCHSCGVDRTWIVELVREGVLEPEGQSEAEWRFEAVSIRRIATARRLERDFSLNAPGLALVLDLLDRLEDLRSRLRHLERGSGDET